MFRYNNRLISIHLFRDTKKHGKNARMINSYLSNNQTYYETQKKVKESNWHFIESDFFELSHILIKPDINDIKNFFKYV